VQWLEEQLRCERTFNEDLKARLHELEALKDTGMLSDYDKQADDNSREIVVREPLYSVFLMLLLFYSCDMWW